MFLNWKALAPFPHTRPSLISLSLGVCVSLFPIFLCVSICRFMFVRHIFFHTLRLLSHQQQQQPLSIPIFGLTGVKRLLPLYECVSVTNRWIMLMWFSFSRNFGDTHNRMKISKIAQDVFTAQQQHQKKCAEAKKWTSTIINRMIKMANGGEWERLEAPYRTKRMIEQETGWMEIGMSCIIYIQCEKRVNILLNSNILTNLSCRPPIACRRYIDSAYLLRSECVLGFMCTHWLYRMLETTVVRVLSWWMNVDFQSHIL